MNFLKILLVSVLGIDLLISLYQGIIWGNLMYRLDQFQLINYIYILNIFIIGLYLWTLVKNKNCFVTGRLYIASSLSIYFIKNRDSFTQEFVLRFKDLGFYDVFLLAFFLMLVIHFLNYYSINHETNVD